MTVQGPVGGPARSLNLAFKSVLVGRSQMFEQSRISQVGPCLAGSQPDTALKPVGSHEQSENCCAAALATPTQRT